MYDIKEVGGAIEFIDSTWGLQIPVIVFGYHCLGRSKSIRSDKRVITHLIVALQNGKTAAGRSVSLSSGTVLWVSRERHAR